jgi:hypothetical protein
MYIKTRPTLFPGILAVLALIIFGSLGDDEDFMPDHEQNYLSWSAAEFFFQGLML